MSRGFAKMNPEKQRAAASKGGRNAQASGKAHRFDAAKAAEAGAKGGVAVSQDREHMSRIGKAGAAKRIENLRHQAEQAATATG